jgi:hypothetical protein
VGQRIGHSLHCDRRAVADRNLADIYPARLAPDNLLVRAVAQCKSPSSSAARTAATSLGADRAAIVSLRVIRRYYGVFGGDPLLPRSD